MFSLVPDLVIKELTAEVQRLTERVAQYEAARCIMCGCPVAAYHPDDVKKRILREDDIGPSFEIKRLKAKIDLLWDQNVRRREAIEKHARTMEEEGIRTYYFDRELHAVVGIEERPKTWR